MHLVDAFVQSYLQQRKRTHHTASNIHCVQFQVYYKAKLGKSYSLCNLSVYFGKYSLIHTLLTVQYVERGVALRWLHSCQSKKLSRTPPCTITFMLVMSHISSLVSLCCVQPSNIIKSDRTYILFIPIISEISLLIYFLRFFCLFAFYYFLSRMFLLVSLYLWSLNMSELVLLEQWGEGGVLNRNCRLKTQSRDIQQPNFFFFSLTICRIASCETEFQKSEQSLRLLQCKSNWCLSDPVINNRTAHDLDGKRKIQF